MRGPGLIRPVPLKPWPILIGIGVDGRAGVVNEAGRITRVRLADALLANVCVVVKIYLVKCGVRWSLAGGRKAEKVLEIPLRRAVVGTTMRGQTELTPIGSSLGWAYPAFKPAIS